MYLVFKHILRRDAGKHSEFQHQLPGFVVLLGAVHNQMQRRGPAAPGPPAAHGQPWRRRPDRATAQRLWPRSCCLTCTCCHTLACTAIERNACTASGTPPHAVNVSCCGSSSSSNCSGDSAGEGFLGLDHTFIVTACLTSQVQKTPSYVRYIPCQPPSSASRQLRYFFASNLPADWGHTFVCCLGS